MICTVCRNLDTVPEGNLIELRVDLLPEINLEAIKEFRKKLSVPVIFTFRKSNQNGLEKSSSIKEEERMAWIEKLAALQPDYMDIEGETPSHIVEELQASYPKIKWIVSVHFFDITPLDLDTLYESLTLHKATYYKIAVKANTTVDTLRALVWLKNSGKKNVILITMGEAGEVGRILAPYVGSPFTFASSAKGYETAPGQLTFKELSRFQRPNKPDFYGLIGHPVTTSLSDITHNAVFQGGELSAIYVKLNVLPQDLPSAFQYIKSLAFKGLSITMPHKETIIPFLDEIDPTAETIGAVNTLHYQGKWRGTNTDGIGTIAALEKHGPVTKKKVLLIGAGGAAKAILHALVQQQARVTLTNRDEARGKTLAARYQCPFIPLDSPLCTYDIIINSTPHAAPVSLENVKNRPLVMDVKIKPALPPFLEQAKAHGFPVVYGYEMFQEQAIEQFKTWFPDSKVPFRSFMESSIEGILSNILTVKES